MFLSRTNTEFFGTNIQKTKTKVQLLKTIYQYKKKCPRLYRRGSSLKFYFMTLLNSLYCNKNNHNDVFVYANPYYPYGT